MYINFDEAVKSELISDELYKIIPKECAYNGKLAFNSNLSKIVCTQKNCKCHIVDRCYKFIKSIGCNNISYKEVYTIVNSINIITPYQIIEASCNKEYEHILNNIAPFIEQYIKMEYKPELLLAISGIDSISNVAGSLSHGFISINELYEELDKQQILFINNRLGITNSDVSVISVDILNKMYSIKDELIYAETLFKNKNIIRKLNVAFSEITSKTFLNKIEIVQKLEDTFDIQICVVESISEKLDILIVGNGLDSDKERQATILNEKVAADRVNSNEISIEEIGNTSNNQLAPLGYRIFIGTLSEVQNRLYEYYNIEKEDSSE